MCFRGFFGYNGRISIAEQRQLWRERGLDVVRQLKKEIERLRAIVKELPLKVEKR